HRTDDELGLGERDRQRIGHAHGVGQADVGEVDSVGAAPIQVGGEGGVARPQPDVVAETAEMNRQRGAPAAGAQYGDAAAHARTLNRGSVPSRRRARFERCRKTVRVAAATAAPSTGGGLPVANASAGSESEASTDPSDTYFVVDTPATKMANEGSSAAGASSQNAPHAVATPLPPR